MTFSTHKISNAKILSVAFPKEQQRLKHVEHNENENTDLNMSSRGTQHLSNHVLTIGKRCALSTFFNLQMDESNSSQRSLSENNLAVGNCKVPRAIRKPKEKTEFGRSNITEEVRTEGASHCRRSSVALWVRAGGLDWRGPPHVSCLSLQGIRPRPGAGMEPSTASLKLSSRIGVWI